MDPEFCGAREAAIVGSMGVGGLDGKTGTGVTD